MKKVLILATSLVLVGSAGYATGTASGATGYLGASIIASTGSIHGFVYCGHGSGEGEMAGPSPAPRPWSTVWVAGHSFSARTDENGEFVIDYVPPGTYRLGVQTAGMPIRLQYPEIAEVTVSPRTIADVGVLTVRSGCGQCGGDTGGGCEGDTGGDCGGDTGGDCGGDTGGGCGGDTGGGCEGATGGP